jgi:hypothetical protein
MNKILYALIFFVFVLILLKNNYFFKNNTEGFDNQSMSALIAIAPGIICFIFYLIYVAYSSR